MTIKLLMTDLDGTVRLTKSGKVAPQDATDFQVNPPILVARKKYPDARVIGITNLKETSNRKLFDKYSGDFLIGIKHTMAFFPMSYVICCPDDGSNAFYIGCNDFGHYVRDLPAQSPGHYRKPSPGMLLWAMGKEGVLAGECVFIGDYYMDKYAAEAAGVMYRDISEFE